MQKFSALNFHRPSNQLAALEESCRHRGHILQSA
jgi:phenylpropionate dioxygenase-like ring-hydroxylating dioxygenase large terminal subunit